MKKHFALLAVLILVGAGCQSSEEITPEPMPAIDYAAVGADQGIGPAEDDTAGAKETTVTVIDEAEEAETDSSTGSEPAAETTPAPKTINMKSGNFFFDPSEITAEPGQQITIRFTENVGFHTFVIDSINLVKKVEADGTVTFNAPTVPCVF